MLEWITGVLTDCRVQDAIRGVRRTQTGTKHKAVVTVPKRKKF